MHDQNPKVSVVIPTYNRAHLIRRAIQSVLDQTYQDFEIIVIDDCSADNTDEIIKNMKEKKIKYIRHNKNKGASAARNTGIKASRGEYIAFQDSDDEWFPDKLEKQITTFDNCSPEVGVVYTGLFRIENDKKIYIPEDRFTLKEGKIYSELLKGNFVGTPAVLIKRECFEKIKYFDENLPALEDWELWIEISKHYTFKYINKPLLCSYSTPNSVNSNENKTIKALEMIVTKHLGDFKNHKKILSEHYYLIGFKLYSNGDLKKGKTYLIKASKADYKNTKAALFLLSLLFGTRVHIQIRGMYRKIRSKI